MFSLKLSSPSKEYFENLKTYLLTILGEKVKKRSFSTRRFHSKNPKLLSLIKRIHLGRTPFIVLNN